MPPLPAGSPGEALLRQYTYLTEMARQLNLAEAQVREAIPAAAEKAPGLAKRADLAAQYQNLKALIIKSADTVRAEMERLEAELTGSYLAKSDFGSYVEQLSLYLEANPEAVTQYYKFAADLRADLEQVDTDFAAWRTETGGYIRTGIVAWDGDAPIYGVAVGQDLTVHEVDGETVVDQRQFRSTFTANRLSFWQDETEVAYISDNRLYIRSAEVLDGLTLGPWRLTTSGGLAIQWNG